MPGGAGDGHSLDAADGDPVDVLVLTPVPLISGSVVSCRPVGVLKMTDESGDDAKVLAVPIDKLCKGYRQVQDFRDLQPMILEQIAQQMQAKMAKMQEELAKMEFEVSSGGGMVTVKMNGQQEVLDISIEEEVFKDGDKEMLEDLIVAAINEARQKAADVAKEQMASLTGGMNIPGLF